MTHENPWTAERTERLIKLWADKLTGAQIATELHTTRQSVVAKARRLKLAARPNGNGKTAKKPRAKPRKRAIKKLLFLNNGALRLIESTEQDQPPPMAADIPPCERKQLLDLNPHDCRWPYGDPGTANFYFCGQSDCPDGQPYCAAHSRMAYVKSQPARPYYLARRYAA